jgi:DNA-binding response OmpR family regulator
MAMDFLIADSSYAAMTLDIMLPDKDGLTFLQQLREEGSARAIPVIIVSALAEDVSGKLKGLAMGVIDCLKKPIDIERLIRAIRSVVSTTDKPHILHVEDDEDIVSVLAYSIKDTAHVTRASSLAQAKHFLQEKAFDLIILDIGLPDGSGLEVLKILKQNGSSIPVIIFSADEVSEEISSKVAASLTKSKSSGDRIVSTITTLISKMKKPDTL